MIRTFLSVCCAALLALAALPAQSQAEISKFASDSKKLVELNDEKALDKLMKASTTMPLAVVYYVTNIALEKAGGKKEHEAYLTAVKASWSRAYEGSDTLERVDRWASGLGQSDLVQFQKAQASVQKAYDYFATETAKDNTKRVPFEQSRDALMQAAKLMEATGHKAEAAQAWYYVALALERIPEKSNQDRMDRIAALEQFVSLREAWSYTDFYFVQIKNLLKAQRDELGAKQAEGDKRKAEGYAENVKGIDGLVVAGAKEAENPLAFAMLENWEDEADYCQRGGVQPPFWWYSAFGTDTKDVKLAWFRRSDVYFVRTAPGKFGISSLPSDATRLEPIEPSAKAKPVTFHLDAEKKVPYAMFFWSGSDREKLGECEVNLAPSPQNTPIYYRSASSWTATVGGESITFYDDNASGRPMDGKPYEGDFRMPTIGYPKDDDRSKAPLLDSMRIGKGPRVPFSEFVKLGGAWHYIRRLGDDKLGDYRVGVRPLNPEYVKTAKVKLIWQGPKNTAPDQLVLCGHGDLASACFDVASGKEIEVPAGEYSICYGRIVEGKGARATFATIYRGDSKPFPIEADKVNGLQMGAPFTLDFEVVHDGQKARIDGTRIRVKEQLGCVLAEMHGWAVIPDVLAAKAEDGKGAKPVGKFVRFTDSALLTELVNKLPDLGLYMAMMPVPQGAKDSMVLEVTLPAAGSKVGLEVKKHPLFGRLVSTFR